MRTWLAILFSAFLAARQVGGQETPEVARLLAEIIRIGPRNPPGNEQ